MQSLTRHRTRRGLTIEKLAALANIEPNVVLRFEQATLVPSIADLIKLCRALKLTNRQAVLLMFESAHQSDADS